MKRKEMEKYLIELIKAALQEIDDEYFNLVTTYEPSGIIRERVFCYEFYHQMRSLMTDDLDISLNGEILPHIDGKTIILFSEGDFISVASTKNAARFLLIGGKPLKEPIAWYRPIVMNTDEELKKAFKEFQIGTFIKKIGPKAVKTI